MLEFGFGLDFRLEGALGSNNPSASGSCCKPKPQVDFLSTLNSPIPIP